MKKNILIVIGLFFLFSTQLSWNFKSSQLNISEIPQDFKFDGCSMFPDGNYGDCCLAHDKQYFFGGSAWNRLESDMELLACVGDKSALHKPLGVGMFFGVRIGGAPIFPTSFRWGFGRDRY